MRGGSGGQQQQLRRGGASVSFTPSSDTTVVNRGHRRTEFGSVPQTLLSSWNNTPPKPTDSLGPSTTNGCSPSHELTRTRRLQRLCLRSTNGAHHRDFIRTVRGPEGKLICGVKDNEEIGTNIKTRDYRKKVGNLKHNPPRQWDDFMPDDVQTS